MRLNFNFSNRSILFLPVLFSFFMLPQISKAGFHSFGMDFTSEVQEKEYLGGLCQSNDRATRPKRVYDNQICSDFKFDVLNWKLPESNVFGYKEVSRRELNAYNIVNPLDLPELKDYKVVVVVNKDTNVNFGPGQRVLVFARNSALEKGVPNSKESRLLYYWKASTGKRKFATPNGLYNIKGFSPNHLSHKYNDISMYWSLFFNGGMAIHSFNEFEMTNGVDNLGAAVSHGCVRLETHRAQRLYHLVGQTGLDIVPSFKAGKYSGKYDINYATLVMVANRHFDLNRALSKIN